MDTNRVRAQVLYIAEALLDNAHRFTCSEAEAVYDLFAEVGRADLAARFRTLHAEQDEPDDLHILEDGVWVFAPVR